MRSSSALRVLAFRQFSTARPSASTPDCKNSNADQTLHRAQRRGAVWWSDGVMEWWSGGLGNLHGGTTPILQPSNTSLLRFYLAT